MNQAVSQRETSKQQRRERIISTARELIRTAGVDGLSIRNLADRAGVTVPTIYNLVGNKTAILEALAREITQQLVKAHRASTTSDPIAKVEEVVSQLLSIYAADEKLCREVLAALDRLDSPMSPTGNPNNPGKLVAIEDCEHALHEGLLLGNFPTLTLAEGLINAFTQAQNAWLLGHIALTDMEKSALKGCFITLAADASPALHARLVKKMRRLAES